MKDPFYSGKQQEGESPTVSYRKGSPKDNELKTKWPKELFSRKLAI